MNLLVIALVVFVAVLAALVAWAIVLFVAGEMKTLVVKRIVWPVEDARLRRKRRREMDRTT